ncbi:MAG: hypothetical protein WB424_16455 [Terracidiphilus sp.]
MSFGSVIKDIAKGIAWPFVHAAQVIEVLTAALKDEPSVKDAVIGLIQEIKTVGEDALTAAAAKGLDVPDDILTIEAAQTLYTYVQTKFLPAVESAYKDEAAALQSADIPAPAAAEAAPATPPVDPSTIVYPGPGLHNVAPTA